MNTNVIDFIHTNRDRYISELKHYLAIPSISALPEHQEDVKRCAQWTADEMTRIGLENVRLVETPGNPVVCGDWLHARRYSGDRRDRGRRRWATTACLAA